MSLDPADTIELTETLDFIAGWLASDPAHLTPSLLDYVGHPAYGPQQLRQDLGRLTLPPRRQRRRGGIRIRPGLS